MKEQIARLFSKDVMAVISFVVLLWLVLGYVMYSLTLIVHSVSLKTVLVASGVGAGIFATLTVLAVISHLRNHKEELYTEELKYSQNI